MATLDALLPGPTRGGFPVLPGYLPVLGHVLAFVGDTPTILREASLVHGPLFWLKGGHWLLVCAGAEGFELLKNRVTSSAHIRQGAATLIGDAVLAQDGQAHRHMRTAMNGPFTPRGITASGAGAIAAEVVLDKVRALREGPVVILEETQPLALHIIFRVMGIGAGELDDWSAHYQQFLLAAIPPHLDFPLSPMWRAKRGRAWLDGRFRRIMEAARGAGSAAGMVRSLLAARDDEGHGLTDDEMIDNVRLLALAGHETTASTMAWATLELARRPELWDALCEEALAAPGIPRSPEELRRYPFAEALFRETLRLYPPVSLTTREAMEPLTLHGREIPAGTLLGVPLGIYGLDPALFPDPTRFDPSRWLEKKTPVSPIETAAFGGGPHFCLGYHFAWMETVQFLTALARELAAKGLRPRLGAGTTLTRRYRPFAQPPKGSTVVLARG